MLCVPEIPIRNYFEKTILINTLILSKGTFNSAYINIVFKYFLLQTLSLFSFLIYNKGDPREFVYLKKIIINGF